MALEQPRKVLKWFNPRTLELEKEKEKPKGRERSSNSNIPSVGALLALLLAHVFLVVFLPHRDHHLFLLEQEPTLWRTCRARSRCGFRGRT